MISRLWLLLLGAVILPACLPTSPTIPTYTETPPPVDTPAPTETIVWFPPTATHTPFPTPQITPTIDYRVGVGEMIFSDNFSSEGHWQLGMSQNRNAAIGVNEISIVVSGARTYMSSTREQPILGNFYLEITAQPNLCRGMDEYGLLLRVSSESNFYRFSLSCDGQVRFERVIDGVPAVRQDWMVSGSVPPGAPSIPRLAVFALGDEMRFFVNEEYLFTIMDAMINSGRIGVFARSASAETVTINFSDLKVWEIVE